MIIVDKMGIFVIILLASFGVVQNRLKRLFANWYNDVIKYDTIDLIKPL